MSTEWFVLLKRIKEVLHYNFYSNYAIFLHWKLKVMERIVDSCSEAP